MITKQDVLSIGVLRRTQTKELPPFVFVERDGLLVPYRSSDVSELVGNEIFVLRSDMQEDGEECFTWQDLVGFELIDAEDGPMGKIEYVDEQTINTLATLSDGRLVPLHEDFITEIDADAKVLRVNLPFSL